jgi:cyclopropane fatty-acyl-phospholipid synthase-like methyltransferase
MRSIGQYAAWWYQVTDRKFLLEVYRKVGLHLKGNANPRVLDLGVENYNTVCKYLLDNDEVEYWQLEPNRKSTSNDGFFHCTVQECMEKYPNNKEMFDVILDIGVLGWNGISFPQDEQEEYIKNVLELLKPQGIYILHSDRVEREKKYEINFDKYIYSNFNGITFQGFSEKETIECPRSGTIWDIRFLQKKVDDEQT